MVLKWILAMLAVLGLATGCSPKASSSDEAERDHPAMRKARELEAAGDLDGARFTYQALLERDPPLARAHLALAFLLDKQIPSSVDAIYHYQRYLTLRPDTEKRKMIEEHIRVAQLAYVATVFTNQAAILRHIGDLERENTGMRVRMANLEAQNTQLRATVATLRAKAGGGIEPIAPVRPTGRTVKVERGDTLRIIASRYFGDQERWREIFEANREQLKSPGDLKVGQLILVPDRRRL